MPSAFERVDCAFQRCAELGASHRCADISISVQYRIAAEAEDGADQRFSPCDQGIY